MIVDDAIRATFGKLQELAEKIVNSIEQFFKEWLVEEYPTLEEIAEWFEKYYKEKKKKDKERFFPSDQLAYIVVYIQNLDNRPGMFWSGFV